MEERKESQENEVWVFILYTSSLVSGEGEVLLSYDKLYNNSKVSNLKTLQKRKWLHSFEKFVGKVTKILESNRTKSPFEMKNDRHIFV